MAKDILGMTGEFVEALIDVYGMSQTLDIIREKAMPVLGECNVAKCVIYYSAPSNMAYKNDSDDRLELMIKDTSDIDTEDIISKDFYTPARGCVGFILYHAKGDTWNMRERLDYMMNLMLVAFGRGRVYTAYEKVSCTDSLTGVPNRLALVRFTTECQKHNSSQYYTSAFINIKNFKWINDKYGSGAGDRYLSEFCKIVLKQVGEDEFFGRLGGDNFVFVVKNEDFEARSKMLRNIHFNFELNEEKQIEVNPKLRAGIYKMKEGDGMHEIMQAMTAALLYARMPDTEDFMEYHPYMEERDKKLRKVHDSFPEALKNNEFLPFYQPKVSVDGLKLCGAEALCRWKKEDSFVPPMDFIPILELDGSITKLDFYMLDKVCADIESMSSRGLNPGRISVNFSKHHIHNKELSKKVIDIVDSHNVKHENIEIELTEMYSYDDFDEIHNFIGDMQKEGIAVSLDDFGTGYSSLNMLTGLDINVVKLDKSFMDNIENRPKKHHSMVKNIVRMVNELDMETVSEGIETKEQYELLNSWGCMMIQGYYFDKPMPLEDFEKRVMNPKYEI